jgi:hypothetical protein
VDSGPSPFAARKVPVPIKKRGSTVESLSAALSIADDAVATDIFWELASQGRISEIPDQDLFLLAVAVNRRIGGLRHNFTAVIFHELIEVRNVQMLPYHTLLAGMRTFGRFHSPDMMLACLSRYRKQGGAFTPETASLATRAYLSKLPPDLPMAGQIMKHVMLRIGKEATQVLKPHIFAELISRSNPANARKWHELALRHYGFPLDPISSSTKAITLLQSVFSPPLAFNASRVMFDSSLSRNLAYHGQVETCSEILRRWDVFSGDNADRAVANLRTSLVIAHSCAGDLMSATELYLASLKDSRGVDMPACEEVMSALASAGRESEAMAVFHTTLREMEVASKGSKEEVRKALEAPYAAAIRIAHPSAQKVSELIKEMRRKKIVVSRDLMTLLGSCFLADKRDLWDHISTFVGQPPEVLVYCFFQSLVLGNNIYQLPRLWKQIMERILSAVDDVRTISMVVQTLSPRIDHDFYALLRSEEFDAQRFADGRTGNEWADLMENVREDLASKLAEAGHYLPSPEDEMPGFLPTAGLKV